jgi:1,4-dihydroxy-6-naphthoate synthase
MDLGEFWEQKTKSPIPLGGIVMRNEFTEEVRAEIDRLIRDSVAFAEAYYPDLSDYVTHHSQEMQESVMRQHIDLYVNQFSLSLGDEGRRAVDVLLEVYNSMKVRKTGSQEV